MGYRARVVWKPRYQVLNVSGYVFSMADLAEQTACLQKVAPPPELETTVDRVFWEGRIYGGYTGAHVEPPTRGRGRDSGGTSSH